jgi:hypothetical protein
MALSVPTRLLSERSRSAFVDTWIEKHRAIRRGFQEEGREAARRQDPLHLAGCMLYWAEGSKSRNCATLCNSDVRMLQFFRRFLVEAMAAHPQEIVISINVYLGNGLELEEIEAYWLEALDLSPSCTRKHMVNHFPTSSSGKKTNRLPYGVCRLTVHDTRLVQHIFGAIQEYVEFEEPRWLDCNPRAANSA